MRMTLLICAVALATTYGCATTPADPAATATSTTTSSDQVSTPAAAPSTATSSPSESGLVCESVASTGTRLAKRTCKSHAQIEQDRQNAKDTTNVYQRDGGYQWEKGS